MPEYFDWQTEDEKKWHEGPEIKLPASRSRNRKGRWLAVVVIVICVLTAATIIYSKAQDRLEKAEAGRRADILSSYELIAGARRQADRELFTTFLSGADVFWATTQQDLFQRGWLYDRRSFGLGDSPIEVSEPAVELSPELDSAILSEIRRYRIVFPGGEEQVVSLKNESVYRLGQRWLLAPPKDDYWGAVSPLEENGSLLTLKYPERDQAIANRLFADMDQKLLDLCQSTDYLNCPPNLRVEIEFSRDPDSFITTMDRYFEDGYLGETLRRPGSTIQITLPTPTLLGVPLDEQSYEALFRAYVAYAAGAVMDRFTDSACCASEMHRQAMIRNRLVSLGLMPWLAGQDISGNESSMVNMGYDLQLMCHETRAKAVDVYHLNSKAGIWRTDRVAESLVSMQGLPDASGVVLLENRDLGESYETRLFILGGGEEMVLFQDDLTPENAQSTRFEVREREQIIELEVPLQEFGYSNYSVFDLTGCNETSCPVQAQSLASHPYWSTLSNQWLVRLEGLIWLHQEEVEVVVGDGFAPFWIDSDRFGYVRQAGNQEFIVTSSVSGEVRDMITPINSFTDALPDIGRGNEVRIGRVLPDPNQPATRWYVLAFVLNRSGLIEEALMMDVSIDPDRVELIHKSPYLNSIALSPAGSKLAATYYDPASQSWQSLIHGAAGEEQQTLTLKTGNSLNSPPTISWSPDGKWLGLVSDGLLVLWSPDAGISLQLVPPTAGCMSLAWVLSEPA